MVKSEFIELIWNVDNYFNKKYNMTYGKKYNVRKSLDTTRTSVQVVNDSGNIQTYLRSSFITLEEFREQKLNKILNG